MTIKFSSKLITMVIDKVEQTVWIAPTDMRINQLTSLHFSATKRPRTPGPTISKSFFPTIPKDTVASPPSFLAPSPTQKLKTTNNELKTKTQDSNQPEGHTNG